MSSLGEEYPKEQKRCRELLLVYKGLGPRGTFGVGAIEDVLTRAEEAMSSGDTIGMIGLYEEMQGLE